MLQNIRYLISLIKGSQELHTEKIKSFQEKLKKTKINDKVYTMHRVGRLNIFKIVIVPKLIYRFNATSIKIP